MNSTIASSSLERFLITIGIVVVLYLIAFIIRKIINLKVEDIYRRNTLRNILYYIAFIISVIFILFYWIKNVTALSAILGGLGAGIILSLREPVSNFAGWLVVIFRRPYAVGDRVQIGEIKGDVINIKVFFTILLEIGSRAGGEQSTGRVVHIPNNSIFNKNVFNYTLGFKYIWNEVPVTITFESNYKKARSILEEILKSDDLKVHEPARKEITRMANRHVIHFKTLTPFVWIKIVDSGVQLTMRYLCDARNRRTTEHFVYDQVLTRFNAEKDIELAYTTYRIFKRGK